MIGILLVTHGDLGASLLQCVEHIMGPGQPQVACLAVDKNDAPELLLDQARALLRQVDNGSGVLVLIDIFGATPSNVACRLVESGRVEAIAGVGLPMLLRAMTYRHQSLDLVVCKAVAGGVEGVRRVIPGECDAAA